MSLPEPTYQSSGQKVRVSIMLKVPIDLELELSGMLPTHSPQDKGKESQTGGEVQISKEAQAEIEENIQALSNQIVAQLLQDKRVSTPKTQHEQDNLGNQVELCNDSQSEALKRNYVPTFEKKRQGYVFDSLNNTLTLAFNTVGAVLFLGKLANYTWE